LVRSTNYEPPHYDIVYMLLLSHLLDTFLPLSSVFLYFSLRVRNQVLHPRQNESTVYFNARGTVTVSIVWYACKQGTC